MESTTITMGRAVLCDDDALIRSVIRQALADTPIEIVGEADSAEEALTRLRETGANILVLDLALRAGNGEELLRRLQQEDQDVHVVVYSAYAADATALLDAGASAVVDKPDFGRLQSAVAGIAAALGVTVDRRRDASDDAASRFPPPTVVSLSGFEPWDSFLKAVGRAAGGDALLCTDVVPRRAVEREWEHVLASDHRLALGRVMATTRRGQDRVSLTPDGRPVLLVVSARPEAPTAVFERLRDRWQREADVGRVVGAFGLVHDDDDPLERLVVVEGAVDPGDANPLRMV